MIGGIKFTWAKGVDGATRPSPCPCEYPGPSPGNVGVCVGWLL